MRNPAVQPSANFDWNLCVIRYKYALRLTGVTSSPGPATAVSPVLRFLNDVYKSSVSSSAHIPAPASNIQPSIVVATEAGRHAVAPIWGAAELIRDPFSGAAQGQVGFNLILLANFAMTSDAGWTQVDFKLS